MRSVLGFCVVALAVMVLPAAAQPAGARQASGTVSAISAASLTIESGSGSAKTSKTFVIDDKTSVIARGATHATKGQERAKATSMIGNGDSVTVSYDESGSTMHATQIRVTKAASHK
jgi:hypothetical protein